MDKSNKALDLFYQGYNCAQAVAGAFSAEVSISEADLFRLTAGFGGGIGGSGEVCGALMGAITIYSLKFGQAEVVERELKYAFQAEIQALIDRFQMMTGNILCRDLLANLAENPRPTTRVPAKRCEFFVVKAVELLEDVLVSKTLM